MFWRTYAFPISTLLFFAAGLASSRMDNGPGVLLATMGGFQWGAILVWTRYSK